MAVILITIFLFVPYAWLIIFYRVGWLQIQLEPNVKNELSTLISVIIPARNEENNIYKCLESLSSQTYPAHLYQVIVIDDYSTDKTAEIAKSFNDRNVSILLLKDFIENENLNSYKKRAIEIAIAKATGELIVTTDADCIVSSGWLQTIASFYEKYHPAFIAAPVEFIVASNNNGLREKFLEVFQCLDFITMQGITGASVHKKFHNMCNGANLAYKKKAFYETGGFKGIDNIASGDDMLLMHKISEKYPNRTLFLKSANAIVQTKPAKNLSDFFNQRIRWASKTDKYRDKRITAVLIFVYLFNVWIFTLGIISFFYDFAFYCFIVLLIAKILCELFFLYPVAKFFKKQKLLWWFPAMQPFHIIYIVIAGWLGKFGSYKWKGRRVK
jgi:cellulose synthase/poly-beta-1,6-N-acetylglucosamine synthase-like glycosyltransferase